MRMLRYLASAMLVALAFSSALARDVKTDYDHHANFSRYRTYHWERVKTSNPLWQDRIRETVDRDLQAKGLQKVESGGDLALTAVGATHNEHEYQTFYNGLPGWRWRRFGETATTTVTNYHVGTLVLDMYDSRTRDLVWRGWASDTLSNKPEKNQDKLSKSINKMFDHFPPEEKG